MEPRRARTQISAVEVEKGWNSAYLAVVLAVGLLVGLLFGIKDLFLRPSQSLDEGYLVLSSTFYAQDPAPANAQSIKERLVAQGFSNPGTQVVQLGDRYALSKVRDREQEADNLKIFGEGLSALALARDTTTGSNPVASQAPGSLAASASNATPALSPTTTTVAGATSSAAVLSLPTVGASLTPTLAATPSLQAGPMATVTPLATTTPSAPTPTITTKTVKSTPTAQAASGSTSTGITKSDSGNVVLRKEPSTKSTRIIGLPAGTKVEIVATVSGSASDPGINPKEIRWYKVRYKEMTGYIYYNLLTPSR